MFNMLSKLRPNVVALATLVGIITIIFGNRLLSDVTDADTVLALLVGVGLGGLVSVMGGVAQDPPPPTVPADVHERLMAGKSRD